MEWYEIKQHTNPNRLVISPLVYAYDTDGIREYVIVYDKRSKHYLTHFSDSTRIIAAHETESDAIFFVENRIKFLRNKHLGVVPYKLNQQTYGGNRKKNNG